MKIEKQITRVEIIEDITKLNEALENGAVLIETLKTRDIDNAGFYEYVKFIVGY